MMSPYLSIPLSLPGDEGQGNPDMVVTGKVIPANVIAYHPGYAWGTFIYLTTGQAFLTPWTIEEYENAIEQYWLEISKATTRKIRLS